ncbi:DUF1176 domain-containing protein [Amorphus sp. 3PC139-8]|uniref:DUF1176 domain-containing protein n=1 Tax=Amorphus sp. 3PC139-8 TaxID=2735676 RepID=UPI00345CD2FA
MRSTISLLAFAMLAAPAAAQDVPPLYKTDEAWKGYCLSSGVCSIFTETGDGQFVLFRAPSADEPVFACYQPYETGTGPGWYLSVEGATLLASTDIGRSQVDWENLLDSAPTGPLAAYARHLDGNGLVPCAGPVRIDGLAAQMMQQATTAELEVSGKTPADPDIKKRVSLDGFTALALWLDDRQNRVGTTTALARPGKTTPVDGPSATAIASADAIPSDVKTVWSDPSTSCDQIDAKAFGAADAVSVSLDAETTLFVLPCGQPGNNAPRVAILAPNDGVPSLVELETESGGKTVTETQAGDLAWDGRNRDLVGTWSMGQGCTRTTVWPYRNDGFEVGQTSRSEGC